MQRQAPLTPSGLMQLFLSISVITSVKTISPALLLDLATARLVTKAVFGRLSDPVGRNASKVQAGLERCNVDADPPPIWGRPRGKQSTHAPVRSTGVMDTARWKGDARNRGRPARSEVAASTLLLAADRAGVGQGRTTVEA